MLLWSSKRWEEYYTNFKCLKAAQPVPDGDPALTNDTPVEPFVTAEQAGGLVNDKVMPDHDQEHRTPLLNYDL